VTASKQACNWGGWAVVFARQLGVCFCQDAILGRLGVRSAKSGPRRASGPEIGPPGRKPSIMGVKYGQLPKNILNRTRWVKNRASSTKNTKQFAKTHEKHKKFQKNLRKHIKHINNSEKSTKTHEKL
jgi:hypothetical protein